MTLPDTDTLPEIFLASRTLEDEMLTVLADELDPQGTVTDDYRNFQARYMNDLAAFANDCIRWRDSDKISHYQLKAMQALATNRRMTLRGPHGLGKTAFAAIAILWFALTRDGLDWKVPVLASAWRQLTKYLLPEVHKWQRQLRWDIIGRKPFTRRELLVMNLKLSTGEVFAVASDNPAYIEGAHAANMLYVFDESKSIPDATWDAAEGAFSTGNCYWLAISTPGGMTGRFYDIHARKQGYEDWHVIHVTLEDAIEAGRISREWAEQRRLQWGEKSSVYINRVLGEFASDDTDGVINLADIERSNERWLVRKEAGAFNTCTGFGVDIGRGGDLSVIAHEYDDNAITELERMNTRNSMSLAGRVSGLLRKNNQARAVIDLGYDPGIYDNLREETDIHTRVIPFVAASKETMLDETGELGFVNLRSAAWWNLRELLKHDLYDLPPDDILTGDLTAPRWLIRSGGKIAVESKGETETFGEGVKAKLGRSTDSGDAVIQIAMKKHLRSDDTFGGRGHVENYKSKWTE